MKTKNMIIRILTGLPMLIALVSLFFLPDMIPAHFDVNGQADRWGSKYEILIFPITIFAFSVMMWFIKWYTADHEKDGKNNVKAVQIVSICVLALFNAMNLYIVYLSFRAVSNLSLLPIDITAMVFCFVGIIMVIMGNIMPTLRMNSVIGLRTPWNTKAEILWKKSQRFGGILGIVSGVAIIVISLFTRGLMCVGCCLSVIFVFAVVCTLYTYVIAHKIKN